MQFIFNGSLEEFIETIYSTAQKLDRAICVNVEEPNILKIGFHRLKHGGGRYFVATFLETDTQVVLQGEIHDLQVGEKWSKTVEFRFWLGCLFGLYMFMEILLLFMWLPIFHFSHIWIPIILPVIVLIFFRILGVLENRRQDTEFVAFMSTFTSRYRA